MEPQQESSGRVRPPLRFVEQTLGDTAFLGRLAPRGLAGLALAFLMEKAELPDFASPGYDARVGTTFADCLGKLNDALATGCMDVYWARIVSLADRTQLVGAPSAPRLVPDDARGGHKLWQTLAAADFRDAEEFIADAFDGPIGGEADAGRRAIYQLLKLRVMSMAPGTFGARLAETSAEIDADAAPPGLADDVRLAKDVFAG